MRTHQDKLKFFSLFEYEALFQEFLLEILPDFGFSGLIHSHGPKELGKDIIGTKQGSLITQDHIAFVVKRGDASGKSGTVAEILNQVQQSFDNPYIAPDGNIIHINKVIVSINGKFTANFREEINNNVRFKPYSANTYFWDRHDLVKLIDSHCPERWDSLHELFHGIDEKIRAGLLEFLRLKGWPGNFDLFTNRANFMQQYAYLCEHLKASGNSYYQGEILKYLEKYNLEEAEQLLVKDLEELEDKEAKNKALSAARLFELAKLRSIQGKHEKAEETYLKSFEYDSQNTDALSDYGLLLYFQDKFQKSISVLNRAYKLDLEFSEGAISENSIARKLNACHSLFALGRYAWVNDIVLNCLEEAEEILDPAHSLFSVMFNFIGQVNLNLGKYEEAAFWTQKAVDHFEDSSNKREYYTSLNNLGQVHLEMGNAKGRDRDEYARALQFLSRAFTIAVEMEKEDFSLKDILLSNIGVANYYLGDFEKAIDYYNESLQIQLEKFGPNHHKIANRYNNLANCHTGLEQYEQSRELLQKSLKINLSIYKTQNHIEVAKNYFNLGTLSLKQKDLEQGAEFLKTAKSIFAAIGYQGVLNARIDQLAVENELDI